MGLGLLLTLIIAFGFLLTFGFLCLADADFKKNFIRLFDIVGTTHQQVRAVVIDKTMTLGRTNVVGALPVMIVKQPDTGSLKVRIKTGEEEWMWVYKQAYDEISIGDDIGIDICRGRFTDRLYLRGFAPANRS